MTARTRKDILIIAAWVLAIGTFTTAIATPFVCAPGENWSKTNQARAAVLVDSLVKSPTAEDALRKLDRGECANAPPFSIVGETQLSREQMVIEIHASDGHSLIYSVKAQFLTRDGTSQYAGDHGEQGERLPFFAKRTIEWAGRK